MLDKATCLGQTWTSDKSDRQCFESAKSAVEGRVNAEMPDRGQRCCRNFDARGLSACQSANTAAGACVAGAQIERNAAPRCAVNLTATGTRIGASAPARRPDTRSRLGTQPGAGASPGTALQACETEAQGNPGQGRSRLRGDGSGPDPAGRRSGAEPGPGQAVPGSGATCGGPDSSSGCAAEDRGAGNRSTRERHRWAGRRPRAASQAFGAACQADSQAARRRLGLPS